MQTSSRPNFLTLLCFLNIIGAILTLLYLFSPQSKQMGAWFPMFLSMSVIINLALIAGIWMMRKMAVRLYTGWFLIQQLIYYFVKLWAWNVFLLPALILIMGWLAYKEMK